jgi:apolipoprotein N-acyltransferase
MHWLDAPGAFVRDLTGWRRFFLAFVTGLLSALSFAPFGLFPFLLLGFAILVLLIDGAQIRRHSVRSAALAGWAFGFGQFLAGLYWVAYAFLVDPIAHAWQLPIIALIFPGGLALLPALACGFAARFWRTGPARIFLFAACYAATEWLRGNILTGFPWNLPAYGWGASLGVLQSTAFVGAYGLSLLTILFGASLAPLFDGTRDWKFPGALVALFVLIWLGGVWRLEATQIADVPHVQLRLVQPNVPQQDKFNSALRVAHWRELIDLSLARGKGPTPTHIIWPESAPPFLLGREPGALDNIAILTGTDRVLMTGAVRAETTSGAPPHFFNSFYIFAHGGALIATYDKFHLVPLGEYVPWPWLLKTLGLTKLVNIPGSFDFGDGPHTYTIPGAPPVGPLICYEILFPGEVTAPDRPSWLVNVTDDSWFGPPSSSGPKQHMLIARVRAIEEGLPIARAANTGISAMIDPLGRVRASLALGRAGVVDSALPQALPETVFARFGEVAFFLLLFASLAAAFAFPAVEQRRA